MSERYRVVIVDDSAFMRAAVRRILSDDGRFDVVGEASDGLEAVRVVSDTKPSIVTMDYNMPGLYGAEATRRILADVAVPIVMLSAHTTDGARQTVEALRAGAVDFVAKPGGEVSTNLSEVRAELVSKLVAAARANPRGFASAAVSLSLGSGSRAGESTSPPPSTRAARSQRPMPAGLRVVVLAASTGGPAALSRVLPSLAPGDDNAALLIVQHMPAGFTGPLASQLAEAAGYAVTEAQSGDTLEAGVALVAPGDRHVLVERTGRVVLSDAPAVHGVRPAADVTLKAVAAHFGQRAVGIVMTGMGRDGAVGLASVKAAGGRTIAQDRATSTIYGMPRAAIEMGVVDETVPLGGLAAAIRRMLR